MAATWWGRWLDRNAAERHDITRQWNDPYLTRWTLLGRRFAGDRRKLYVHLFHRGDGDVMHDHPWPFWSLILAGGYWEWTPLLPGERVPPGARVDLANPAGPQKAIWYGPGSLLRRPAEWRHRVELAVQDAGTLRRCWTLMWAGRKVRSWGFWCPSGWIPWREHLRRHGLTGDGCGETGPGAGAGGGT